MDLRKLKRWNAGEKYVRRGFAICPRHMSSGYTKQGKCNKCGLYSTHAWRYEKCVRKFDTKPEVNGKVGKPRYKSEYNIKKDLEYTGRE